MEKLLKWLLDHPLNWELLGAGFAGSTLFMLRSTKRNWVEGVTMVATGTASAYYVGPWLARVGLNEAAAGFLIGMIAWGVTGWLIDKAKDPLKFYNDIRGVTRSNPDAQPPA